MLARRVFEFSLLHLKQGGSAVIKVSHGAHGLNFGRIYLLIWVDKALRNDMNLHFSNVSYMVGKISPRKVDLFRSHQLLEKRVLRYTNLCYIFAFPPERN